MNAVTTIAANTFREAMRDRILYLFLGFAIVLLAGSKLFGMLTVGDESKVILDLGLAGLQFFSMLIAVMMSVTLISREIESRTVFVILAKPVRRWQFLLGKYLGLVATVAFNLALMTAILLAVLAVYRYGLRPGVLLAAAMTLLEMLLVAAFATLFAVLTRPIMGSVLTLGVFLVGHVSQDLWLLTRHLPGAATRTVVAVVYHLVPNLQRFNFKSEVVHGLEVPAAAVGWAVAYGLAFTAVVLLLACLQLGRRDLV